MTAYRMFEYPMTIKEKHIDLFGHMNNAVYLELFEEARWEVITQNGFGFEQINKTGFGPVILQIQIRFSKELKLREQIVIKTQLEKYDRKIGVMKQSMINSAGHICCEADITFGLFDLKQRKLVSPTPEWIKVFGMDSQT